jgi:hypothetical protein
MMFNITDLEGSSEKALKHFSIMRMIMSINEFIMIPYNC